MQRSVRILSNGFAKINTCQFILPTVTTINIRSTHVGIVGAGAVGSACASSLIHNSKAKKISIFDVNTALAEGEAMDLEDEGYYNRTTVQSVATVAELRSCKIIVITAGAKQHPGESRSDLLSRNVKVLKSILEPLFPLDPKTVLLLVSNPVDILTAIAQKLCEKYIPASQVIGSGTYLDTQRFRVNLSRHLDLDPRSIHAYVLGEHGDGQIVPRSTVRIGGSPLSEFGITDDDVTAMEVATKRKAYEIINRKGSTSHGIGQCVAAICDNIADNQGSVMPVCVFNPRFGVYLGWPATLGRSGVGRLLPTPLSEDEERRLQASAKIMKETLEQALAQESETSQTK